MNNDKKTYKTVSAIPKEVLRKHIAKERLIKSIAEIEPLTRDRLVRDLEGLARADRPRKKR